MVSNITQVAGVHSFIVYVLHCALTTYSLFFLHHHVFEAPSLLPHPLPPLPLTTTIVCVQK